MAGYKRKQTTKKFSKRKTYKKGGSYKNKRRRSSVAAAVSQALARNIETKTALYTATDGTEILHNNFITLNAKLLKTTQGVGDPQASNTLCRIGDKVNLRGISLKMMIELNERFTDVTFRLLVIKSARGDTPTRANLFKGISGNKMIDIIETERYSVIGQKWVHMKSNPMSAYGASLAVGEGNNDGRQSGTTIAYASSRATKIVTMWIPGKKFGRGGVLQYETGGEDVKFFDYHVMLYAYSNYSTYQDVFNVGRLNDYVQTMYYKDA